MSARYLVTGAYGAIGAWTLKSLVDRGTPVVAFDLGGSEHRLAIAFDGEPPGSEQLVRVQGDVTDLAQLERVLDEHAITNVIHLAALQVPFVRERPVAGAEVNVVGTVNVLEAARRSATVTAPVVYASSIAVYGPDGTLAGHPLTLYGAFKRANESTAVRYFEDYGVSSIGLRPHTVYGPGRDQGLTSAPTAAMLAAAAGKPFHIPFGGSLQFQYLPDIAEAFIRAGEASGEGASVHDLDGSVASIPEVIALIEDAAGTTGLITADEAPLPFPSQVDGSSFVALLGGSVNRPLAEGVADTIRRFRTT